MADGFYVRKEKGNNGEHKAKHNFAWFLGCFVLLLISITFVLPSTGLIGLGSNAGGIEFGKFGNKRIDYNLNSYLYASSEDYLQRYTSMFGQSSDFVRMQAFSQAFSSAVLYYSYLYYAEKAGRYVGENEVGDYLISKLKDENGNFNAEGWASLPSATKKQYMRNAQEELIVVQLQSELNSADVSQADLDFILSHDRSADFSVIVVKGDNASSNAEDILDDVKRGTTMQEAAEKKNLVVTDVYNVVESDRTAFIPSHSSGGDEGKFYEAFNIPENNVKKALMDYESDKVYGNVISISDTEKLVIYKKGIASLSDSESARENVSNQIYYANQDAYYNAVQGSSLFRNKFESAYNKLFPSRSES